MGISDDLEISILSANENSILNMLNVTTWQLIWLFYVVYSAAIGTDPGGLFASHDMFRATTEKAETRKRNASLDLVFTSERKLTLKAIWYSQTRYNASRITYVLYLMFEYI